MDKTAAIVSIPIGTSWKDAEKALIEATLSSTDGNITVSAKILGVDRCTLYVKIAKYKIERGVRTTNVR